LDGVHVEASCFRWDLYYRDLSQFPLDSRHKRNFDHPDSLESELMWNMCARLRRDERSSDRCMTSRRTRGCGSVEAVAPRRVVIVEGILAMHYAELVACYDFSIYVKRRMRCA